MTKSTMNLQDSFLNQVRKDNTEIKLVLLDGATLMGFVRGFDNFTVIVNSHGTQHLVYKHAIAQIIQRRPPQDLERPGVREEQPAVSDEKHPRPVENAHHREKDKFNTIDLSVVQIDPSEPAVGREKK